MVYTRCEMLTALIHYAKWVNIMICCLAKGFKIDWKPLNGPTDFLISNRFNSVITRGHKFYIFESVCEKIKWNKYEIKMLFTKNIIISF